MVETRKEEVLSERRPSPLSKYMFGQYMHAQWLASGVVSPPRFQRFLLQRVVLPSAFSTLSCLQHIIIRVVLPSERRFAFSTSFTLLLC